MSSKVVYLKGLNGLRAIAAISVMLGHVFNNYTHFRLKFYLNNILSGSYGVTLFFVISGFLITYLLLIEEGKTSKINIKNFYIRRILRIWPIYYLFIFLCLMLIPYIGSVESIQELYTDKLYTYLFFFANIPFIMGSTIPILAHYWSIGVEEQFYLFWPWVVKFSRKRITIITIILILGIFFLKTGAWFLGGKDAIIYRIFTVTRFHCMLIGAIGAIFYHSKHSLFLSVFSNKWIQILNWVLFILVGTNVIQIPVPIASELFAVISLILIIGQVAVEKSIISLENKIFDFLGKISYGIYVIHPLVIVAASFVFSKFEVSNLWLKTFLVYFSIATITIALAHLSYKYFEKPFLQFKKRFMVVKSSNSRY